MQDLWQVHCQTLSIISQKEFKKIKCKDCDCFLEYECVKNILIKYKCLSCNKDFLNKLDEEVKKTSQERI